MKRRRFLTWGSAVTAAVGASIATARSQSTPVPAPAAIAPADSVPPSSTLLRFAALADTGTGDEGQAAVARSLDAYRQAHPFNLILMAGDNIYNNGEIEKVEAVFEQPYASFLGDGVRFRAALGNHDIRTDNGDPQVAYPGFNMLGRYYTFTEGPVQFFALDTNVNADWEAQLSWLDRELASSTARWKVVYGHHPVYSSGYYGTNDWMVENLAPIFQAHRVTLYLCGHDHNYERTRAIDGTTYVVHGSGAGTRPVGQSDWTAHSAERLASVVFEASETRIDLVAVGADSEIFDRAPVA
jgi:acid phosphatase